MAINTQTIRIDLNTGRTIPVAFAHQNDTNRQLTFQLYNNGVAFTPSSTTVKFAYKSPIVNGRYSVITGSQMASGTVSGNTVTVTLPAQYTQVSGVGLLTMILTTSGNTLRPVNIKFVCQGSADGDDTILNASDWPDGLYDYMDNWLSENEPTEIANLKSDLNDYNSYDIIHRIGTFTDRTSASVTYTWNADKTQCTVNGTATDGFSINNLYYSDNIPMPPGMVEGETYPVLFETTNSNIKLELLHYLNGATNGVPTIIEHTSDYTVPNNCTKLRIRLRVNQNTDGTGVVKKVGILNTASNEILMSDINNLSGVSNLYKSSYLYNVQPNGNVSTSKRALSAAVEINGNGIVYVKKLPSNLHYSICTYSTNAPSSYINYYPDGNWHEIETVIVNDPTAKYIRLYFGKKDNTEINDTDFEDAEIAVYNNIVTPVYYTGDTARDNGARAIVNNIRKTIKICSWNTGLWNNGITQYMTASNKYKWMRVFGEIDADIIMTQESPYTVVSGNTVTYPDLFGYKYDYLQTPLSSETVYLSKGIASTFPLANLSRHYFSDNQRTYIKSYIIIDDTVICLINAHLSYEAAVRPHEISELIAVMNDEEYVIVCGDFNVEALSEFDAFTAEGYKLANGGDFGEYITWPHTTEASPNGVLDNCIVSSNISIANVKMIDGTGSSGISDHVALVSTLIVN